MSDLPDRLPDAPWRHKSGLVHLLEVLGHGNGRFVGGAVRDSLLGIDVKDVDIATIHRPDVVLSILREAGIKAIPTGMDHGTITAVLEGGPVEITTLRHDMQTDGRRATVAFADDWREDAARRDFTFNALYADPLTGEIFDYFGGRDDLTHRRVRFIGSASARIAEDHLRILRYFRFMARFGSADAESADYKACVAQANSLMALSRERIADELLKLLTTADPVPAVRLMAQGGIFAPVLPEIDMQGLTRLEHLVARESEAGVLPVAMRRLMALIPPDPILGEAIAARLKLSNKARKRIALVFGPIAAGITSAEILAYHLGSEAAMDHILLNKGMNAADAKMLESWEKPILPITGGAIIALGLAPGPNIAKALHAIENQWIAEGFPSANRVNQITDQIVTEFRRVSQ